MKQTINIKVNDGRIKGTIYDPARVTAQVLAAFGTGGGGMDGEFTAVTFDSGTNTLPIGAIESDKVKWTITNGLTNNVISFGTGTVGARKSLWIHETSGSFKLFNRELGLDGIFQILTSQPSIDYSSNTYSDHLFECYCIAANQWIFAEVGLPDTITTLPAAVGDLETGKVDKLEGYSLVADTEIAKIHSQNTDNQLKSLDGGTIVSVEDLATIMDLTHPQNTDTILDDGGANEVSAAELRGVVDFANIATPPAAYQIPVVQDISGVKSLKYSPDFVFENGTLKVKGTGNTTGKTLSIFNLAGTENVTVLDNGNVGIGTTDPSVKLSVVGAFAASSLSYLNGGVYAPSYSSDLTNTLKFLMRAAPQSEYARFTSLGHFGIGTTTPAMKLDVSQSTGQCFRLRYDGSTTYKADFTLDSSGNLTIAPAGRTNITGDLNANGVLIDGTQVLSEQQAAIADATDNTTAISQLNLLLNAARAHGLIAT